MLRLALALILAALPAAGEEVVAGLSQSRVSITANFDGSEILIFGAVKRESPPPDAGPLQVIITVAGPSETITVRRKEKRAGIWINTDAVQIDEAPSFYAVATTDPLSEILSQTEDLRHHISIPSTIRTVGSAEGVTDAESFPQALIRIRAKAGLYQNLDRGVSLTEDTLFRTVIALPANLTEGDYATRILLVRDGAVIDEHDTTIFVRKVGLERWIFNLAHEKPLYYGLLSLAIAIIAGWGASSVFTYLRS